MSETMLVPTPTILQVADTLEEVIARLINACATIPRASTWYEADVEARKMIIYIIRNVESVITLAQRDLVLLPGALSISRTAYEASLKSQWLLDPTDPFDREVRWLSLLKKEEDEYSRAVKELRKVGGDVIHYQGIYTATNQMRLAIEKELPSKYKTIGLPNLRDMVKSLGEDRKYLAYQYLCPFTHVSSSATRLYSKNMGSMMELGEYVKAEDWYTPLLTCWYSLYAPGYKLLERLGGDIESFLDDTFASSVQSKIDRIAGGNT